MLKIFILSLLSLIVFNSCANNKDLEKCNTTIIKEPKFIKNKAEKWQVKEIE